MKNKSSEIDETLERLIKRKEEIQKKQLVAYSNNMSQQLFSQLSNQLALVEMDIYHCMALKAEEYRKKDDDLDGLIV